MNLEEARERQKTYLLNLGYRQRPDGWWIGKHDAARPLTDETDTNVFVISDREVHADLMIRFVPLDKVPN